MVLEPIISLGEQMTALYSGSPYTMQLYAIHNFVKQSHLPYIPTLYNAVRFMLYIAS